MSIEEQKKNMTLALPPLLPGHRIPMPDGAGTWETASHNILETIAQHLNLAAGGRRVEELLAIPDLWAQTEVFRQALSASSREVGGTMREGHPLSARARSEWRGLLALFPLKPMIRYELRSEVVALSDMEAFGKILRDVAPTTTLTAGHHWGEIGIIYLDKVPVGLMNPATLVSPGRWYGEALQAKAVAKSIPWFYNGRFQDPTTTKGMQWEHIASLIFYCNKLIEGMDKLRDSLAHQAGYVNDQMFKVIRRELAAFSQDAQSAMNRTRMSLAQIDLTETQIENIKVPNGQPGYSLLSRVGTPTIKGIASTNTLDSDLAIKVRPVFKNVLKGVVLIDFEYPEKSGHPETEIRVWGTSTLADLRRDPALEKELVKEMADKGVLGIRKEDLFSPFFVSTAKSRGSGSFTHHPAGFHQALLPFSPLVLAIFTSEELFQNVKVEQTRGGDVVVSLTVTLHNSRGEKIDHMVGMHYPAEKIHPASFPTVLAQWPNFRHPDWSWHYVLHHAEGPQFILSGLFEESMVVKKLSSQDKTDGQLMGSWKSMMRPGVPDKNWTDDNHPLRIGKGQIMSQTDEETMILLHLEKMPVAYFCQIKTSQGQGMGTQYQPAGFVLSPPLPEATGTFSGTVGIDFGTTNTSVYYLSQDSNTPTKVKFANRFVYPYEPISSFADGAHQETIPQQGIEIPFMTILSDRMPRGGHEEPILSATVYYVDQVEDAVQRIISSGIFDTFGQNSDGEPIRGTRGPSHPLCFDLKWTRGREKRRRTRAFLSQVVLQTAAELLANKIEIRDVGWRFSFPGAFQREQLQGFKETCREVVTSMLPTSTEEGKRVEFLSESLAAAHYFNHDFSNMLSQSVRATIDIGGQTSDIAIWDSGKPIWQGSVKLGGREVLTAYLVKNLLFLEQLISYDPKLAAEYKKIKEMGDEGRQYAVEVIINSPKFRERFSRQMVDYAHEGGLRLMQLARLMLAALVHYVSTVLQALAERPENFSLLRGGFSSGDQQRMEEPTLNLHNQLANGPQNTQRPALKLFFGGRASLLFKHLLQNEEDAKSIEASDGMLPELFSGMEIMLSKRPKEEVAYGLVISDGTMQTGKSESQQFVPGATVLVDNTPLPAMVELAALDIDKPWKTPDLRWLDEFLINLERIYRVRVNLSQRDRSEIWELVNAKLQEGKEELRRSREASLSPNAGGSASAGEGTIMEPLFFIAVRRIIQLVISGKITLTSLGA